MKRVLFPLLLLMFAGTALADEYTDMVNANRAEKDQWVRDSEVGPFTAIGQTVLRAGKTIRVVLAADTILLDRPSADIGMPQLELLWKHDAGILYARAPMGGKFTLNRDRIGPVPTTLPSGEVIVAEKFRVASYYNEAGGRVMAFDPELPKRTEFAGLHYYGPDKGWVVEATLEWIENGDTLVMPTSLGLAKRYVRKARLHFQAPSGEAGELTLFTPAAGGEYGFLPFTDLTSGSETYGGGRYLDIEIPEAGAVSLQLDFNNAYNPYCAYTNYYNCPIPPSENALPFAVTAGEKRYK